MTDTPDERAAFVTALRALADHYEATPDLPLPFEAVHQDPAIGTFTFHAQSAGEYTAAVRALGGRREKGTGGTGDRLAATTRTFGPGVVFRVFVPRGEVCQRRVVDTVTKAVTALGCAHCAVPIRLDDRNVWQHVDPEQVSDYVGCDGTTSYEGMASYDVGNVATPPDFTAVSTNTTEVVEWDCKPVLDPQAAS
jgi:hypothetical protein